MTSENPQSAGASTGAARRVLVIETAAPHGGLLLADVPAAWPAAELSVVAEHRFVEPHLHARLLVPTLRDLLGTGRPPLDLVFVDRGPGSHTGVRIGLAVARMVGWQGGAATLGGCSLDALAAMARRRAGWGAGALVAVLPCRAGVVYARRYRPAEGGPGFEAIDEPSLVDVSAGMPPTWTGCQAVGAGLAREGTLRDALDAGLWQSPAGAVEWPDCADLLTCGLWQAGSLPAAEWERTLTPLYLSPITARTLAERRAAGINR